MSTNTCPQGYYCPAGTEFAQQYPCPSGTYGDVIMLKAASKYNFFNELRR